MFGGLLVTSCKGAEQCPSDAMFCDPAALVCRPCIQCIDLKRQTPPAAASVTCITSATQCGSCFTGLVENKKSLNMECVAQQSGGAWDEWLVTLVALHLLALLLCVCVALVLRNFRAYKLRASTSVETGTAPALLPPPPPPPPPPYSPTSTTVCSQHVEKEGTSSPLLEETPSPRLEVAAAATAPAGTPAPSRARESALHLGARVFNEPLYRTLSTSDENYSSLEMVQNHPEMPESMHDRAEHHYSGDSLDITLDKTIVKTPRRSAQKHRVRQDSDRMNDSEDSGYGEPHAGRGSGGAGVNGVGGATFTSNNSIPFFINIYKNFTTASQDDESVF